MAPVNTSTAALILFSALFGINSSQLIGDTPWDTLITTAFAFIPAPMNRSVAEQQGWTTIMDCTDEESVGSPGNVYWNDKDLAAMPIFNSFGQISGLIVGISDPGQYAQKTPWKSYKLADNTTFWGIEVLFRNPDSICNAAQASTIAYGDRLWISNGNEGNYSQVPLNQSETVLEEQGWVLGGCKDGVFKMGFHYWRYSASDIDCNDAYPIFVLYDNGILHAWGVAMGNEDRPLPNSTRWEHPPGALLTSFFQAGEAPTCLAEQTKLYNSMHVFMTSSVLNKTTTCPATTTAQPATTTFPETTEVDDVDDGAKSNNKDKAVVIGIVVAVLCVLSVAAVVAVIVYRRRKAHPGDYVLAGNAYNDKLLESNQDAL